MSTLWPTEILDLADDRDEVRILTTRDGRPANPVRIWIVRLQNDLYVRAAYGRSSDWRARVSARPAGRLWIDGHDLAVTFEPADATPEREDQRRLRVEVVEHLAALTPRSSNGSTARSARRG